MKQVTHSTVTTVLDVPHSALVPVGLHAESPRDELKSLHHRSCFTSSPPIAVTFSCSCYGAKSHHCGTRSQKIIVELVV